MITTKQIKSPITVFFRNGNVFRYPSKQSLLLNYSLDWIAQNVGAEFRTYSHTVWSNAEGERVYHDLNEVAVYSERIYKEHYCVMRDDAGMPVTITTFRGFSNTYRRSREYLLRYYPELRFWNGSGPVPRTGKARGGSRFGKEIRHANAIRTSVTFHEEGEVPPRAKRRDMLLTWDPDSGLTPMRTQKNWKHYRKQQWRDK